MATSGSTDFTLTARGIIDFAYGKLQLVDALGAASAPAAEKAQRELNLMLKGMQKYENLWTLTEGSFTLTANTASFTLSPEPHRVVSARFDNQDTEIPMFELTRDEYFDLPVKTSVGIPTQYYVDRQRDSVVMYVWPLISSVTDETINYNYQRKFEDIDDLTNNLDIRDEYLDVVGYNLAARLIPDSGKESVSAQRIEAWAAQLLNEMQDDDREGMVRFAVGEGY